MKIKKWVNQMGRRVGKKYEKKSKRLFTCGAHYVSRHYRLFGRCRGGDVCEL